MLPDELDQLRYEALDASRAFKRIATALGVERKIPCTPAGWDALAQEVERWGAVRTAAVVAFHTWDQLEGAHDAFLRLMQAIAAQRGPEGK